MKVILGFGRRGRGNWGRLFSNCRIRCLPRRQTPQISYTAKTGSATGDETTGLQTVALKVDNMYCASCPVIVKRTLEGVDGVRKVEVSFRKKSAVVSFDPNQCSTAKLVAATKGVGFPSTVMEAAK